MNSAQRHEAAALELRERKRTTDLLAKAEREELDAAWTTLESKPDVHLIRGPETGLVMVRGRIGGGGSPFNLGEVTVWQPFSMRSGRSRRRRISSRT
jgi:alpha-D-ribose 1-methylphosphonate 5-triphosphate synthase subunit PhnG